EREHRNPDDGSGQGRPLVLMAHGSLERRSRRPADLDRCHQEPLRPGGVMLRLPLAEAQALHGFARDRDVETCAVGLVLPVSASDGERFVVRQLDEVPDAAYAERTASAATLKP